MRRLLLLWTIAVLVFQKVEPRDGRWGHALDERAERREVIARVRLAAFRDGLRLIGHRWLLGSLEGPSGWDVDALPPNFTH